MPILGPPEALTPQSWGAAVDYDAWTDLHVSKDGVALHHGGGSDYTAAQPPYSTTKEAALLRSWEAFHRRKGWRGLAYGWAVGQTGTIYRIRGWGLYGAHRGDVDGDGIANNSEIVPIIWIASGNHHTPTPEADAAITRLRQWILASAPQAHKFYGHQEIQDAYTACPGPGGMAYVTEHRTTIGQPLPPPSEVRMYPTLDLSHVTASSSTWTRGERVKTLQGLLVARGFAPANTIRGDRVDGIAGPGTRAALGLFQTASGLTKDFVVGKNTWEALEAF